MLDVRIRLPLHLFVATALAALCALGPSALASGIAATVETLAGSGALGFRDGAASQATFVYPTGIALGTDGTIYVADAGSQRIRIVRNGTVTTLAGSGQLNASGLWVPGGYRDGSALQARFNAPSGIAVDRNGRVFVADTLNRCIRLITPQGDVTTYAGLPSKDPAHVDGPRAGARFDSPMQLSLAPDGTLYVADFGNGVRTIAPDGTVATVYPKKSAMGVSLSPQSQRDFFVAAGTGMTLFIGGKTPAEAPNPENRRKPDDPRAALGHPYMVATLDDRRLVYTDAWTGAVRYLDVDNGTLHVLVGSDRDDGSNDDAGFADGPLATARVNEASGLALGPSGAILIADSGNRRIRAITGLDLRHALAPDRNLLPPSATSNPSVSLGLVGSSAVWSGTMWDDSLEAPLERGLDAGEPGRVRVEPVRINATTVTALFDYLDDIELTTHRSNVVVVLLNDAIFRYQGPDWAHVLAERLPQTVRKFAAARIPFVVAYMPDKNELGMADSDAELDMRNGRFVPDDLVPSPVPTPFIPDLDERHVRSILTTSGAPLVDLWPAFIDAERRTAPVPFFGTIDAHLSAAGRAFVGAELAKELAPYVPSKTR